MACSSSGRVCHHEPTAWLGDDSSLVQFWDKGVGVSDSGLASRLGWVLDKFGPRTLVIERPRAEVMRSMLDYVGKLPMDREAMERTLDDMEAGLSIQSPLIKRVAYSDLQDFPTLCACFDWLGVTPNGLRQLTHMNIQSDLVHNLNLVRSKAA